MHQALYRKWRPKTFDEVCGQEHITSILKYETQNNKFSHAYLFCGSRGTGKTTCAKILAKAVNCESPVNGSPCNCCRSCLSIDNGSATDVLEMDAASNNGVDDIRDIRDEVIYSPSTLKYRVYIVDEVHMLSVSAFNALLKTLEEPPSHVVFILATTELHKLPSTIISRCQRFDFRRISTDVLSERLAYISKQEGIEYEPEALRIIAKLAQGGMRDAISLLELCAGTKNKVTIDVVDQTIGSGGRENIEKTVKAIANQDFETIFSAIDGVVRSSRDISVFWQELIGYYRDMLVVKTTSSAQRYLDMTENELVRLKTVSDMFTRETIIHHCRILDEAAYTMTGAGVTKRNVAEMSLIKMCDTSLDNSIDALLSRISKLENIIASGISISSPDVNNKEEPFSEKLALETKKADSIGSAAVAKKEEHSDELVLKPLRGWNEIAERAANGDASKHAFLKIAKAYYTDDGKIHLKFNNEFSRSMVDSPVTRDSVRAAISMIAHRTVEDNMLIMSVFDNNEKISDLDEFDEI